MMSKRQWDPVKHNLVFLLENLQLCPAVDHLYQNELLTRDEYERVKPPSKTTETDNVRDMLGYMTKKSTKGALGTFLAILTTIDCGFIADKLRSSIPRPPSTADSGMFSLTSSRSIDREELEQKFQEVKVGINTALESLETMLMASSSSHDESRGLSDFEDDEGSVADVISYGGNTLRWVDDTTEHLHQMPLDEVDSVTVPSSADELAASIGIDFNPTDSCAATDPTADAITDDAAVANDATTTADDNDTDEEPATDLVYIPANTYVHCDYVKSQQRGMFSKLKQLKNICLPKGSSKSPLSNVQIVFFGPPGVGKSTCIQSYLTRMYTVPPPTKDIIEEEVPVCFDNQDELNRTTAQCNVIDIGGDVNNNTVAKSQIRGQVFIGCYDLNDFKSLADLEQTYYPKVKSLMREESVLYVAGLKADLLQNSDILAPDGKALCARLGGENCFEISSKNNNSIKVLFQSAVLSCANSLLHAK